jgi:pimeloyl-ACP methyl ester carboxylesterase
MGIGASTVWWWRSRPVLAARYRTIALDNRGAGRSDVPPGPYSVALMACDAAAVLNAAGVERAHVLGVSMGGMIAQEFALQYPERVLSLVLGCTAAGGPKAVRADAQAVQVLTARSAMTPEEAESAMVPFMYDPGTPRERIEEDFEKKRPWYPTPQGYGAQLQSVFTWQSYDRLLQITAPTLVIHGQNDKLVPAGNGELIASRIPGAELVLIPNANLLFTTDQPEASHAAVLGFLARHS